VLLSGAGCSLVVTPVPPLPATHRSTTDPQKKTSQPTPPSAPNRQHPNQKRRQALPVPLTSPPFQTAPPAGRVWAGPPQPRCQGGSPSPPAPPSHRGSPAAAPGWECLFLGEGRAAIGARASAWGESRGGGGVMSGMHDPGRLSTLQHHAQRRASSLHPKNKSSRRAHNIPPLPHLHLNPQPPRHPIPHTQDPLPPPLNHPPASHSQGAAPPPALLPAPAPPAPPCAPRCRPWPRRCGA